MVDFCFSTACQGRASSNLAFLFMAVFEKERLPFYPVGRVYCACNEMMIAYYLILIISLSDNILLNYC